MLDAEVAVGKGVKGEIEKDSSDNLVLFTDLCGWYWLDWVYRDASGHV